MISATSDTKLQHGNQELLLRHGFHMNSIYMYHILRYYD